MNSERQRKTIRLLAVDPSLTASGWALFDLALGQPVSTGVIAPPGPSMALADRLEILQGGVQELYETWELGEGDVVVCEGPAPLVKNPQSAIKVEHVRGIFETLARVAGALVPGRINPRTVQRELLGFKGKQCSREIVKATAQTVAHQLYGSRKMVNQGGPQPAQSAFSQDIVDALLVGTIAISRIRLAESGGFDLSQAFAEKKRGMRAKTRWGSGRWTESDFKKQQ